MPCGYHMNLEEGLITINGDAALGMEELTNLGRAVLADPRFSPDLPQLVDLRGMEVSSDEDADAALRTYMLTTYCPRVSASIAIVIDGSMETNALASLYHLACAMHKTEIFDHYDQALKWLMRHEFAAANC